MQYMSRALEKRKPHRTPRATSRRSVGAEAEHPEHADAGLTFTPLGDVAGAVVARLAQRCRITSDHARVVISLLHPEAR